MKRRDRVLQIRLNPDEFENLKRQADAEMIPVSTLARRVIMRRAKEFAPAPRESAG